MTNLRIIAGVYGGRPIDAPSYDNTRTKPMSERVRNALFNSLGDEVLGANVLDAFAGTGSLGLEALSRGARHATFVERDRLAQKIISNNLNTLGAVNNTTLVRTSIKQWLAQNPPQNFDLILADPPYHDTQLSTVGQLAGLLKVNGLMVLSHPGRGEVPNLINGIVVVDNRSYGNAYLTFFRRVA